MFSYHSSVATLTMLLKQPWACAWHPPSPLTSPCFWNPIDPKGRALCRRSMCFDFTVDSDRITNYPHRDIYLDIWPTFMSDTASLVKIQHVYRLYHTYWYFQQCLHVSTLWPNDGDLDQPLAQIMACCLTAPSHYLNQGWFFMIGVLCHSPGSKFTHELNL